MQVKVFEAPDMPSGLKKVKETLGPDALILSTRTIRKGKMGLLSKPIMEITAAVDQQWPDHPLQANTLQKKFQPSSSRDADLSYADIWKEKPVRTKNIAAISRKEYIQHDDSNIKNELSELRELVYGLSQKISKLDDQNPSAGEISPQPHLHEKLLFSTDKPVVELLNKLGVNKQTAQTIAKFTRENFQDQKLPDSEELFSFLSEAIAGLFKVNQILMDSPSEQKRIALIGPTGVGKTTTIAKIAANYLSKYNNNIALITIDTYRIAAVQQLKVYGEIMNLPVEVVIKPEGLEAALEKFKDRDLILIDTAGRNPRNEEDMEELTQFIRPHLGIENHLVLSATTRESELDEAIQLFRCLTIDNIIYSKIDECNLLGILLNMHIKNETPISFLTNGQRVPEDIITPDPQTIAGLIMDNHRTFANA